MAEPSRPTPKISEVLRYIDREIAALRTARDLLIDGEKPKNTGPRKASRPHQRALQNVSPDTDPALLDDSAAKQESSSRLA